MRQILILIVFFLFLGFQKVEAQEIFSSGNLRITSPAENVFIITGLKSSTTPEAFTLRNPARVVLDLDNTFITQNYNIALHGHSPVALRLGRHPSKTRVVFDFKIEEPPLPTVEHTGQSLTVSFAAQMKSPIAAPANEKKLDPVSLQSARPRESLILTTDKSVFFFPAELKATTFEVVNDSQLPRQIESSVYLVNNPGQKSETLSPSRNILASPKHFTLEAGQGRAVRLVHTETVAGEKEQAYRIKFFPRGEQATSAPAEPLHEILVLVPVPGPAGLSIKNLDGQIELTNSGKSSILLEDGRACDQNGRCEALPAIHLYPGDSRLLNSREDSFIEFMQKTISGFEVLKIVTPGK